MEEEVNLEDDKKSVLLSIGGFIKKHFKLLIVLIAIIVIAVVVLKAVLGSPEKTVRKFFEALDDQDTSTMMELIDLKGAYVFFVEADMKERKFDDEYYDFDEDDNSYEYLVDNFEDELDEFLDYMDEDEIIVTLSDIKEVKKSKKSKVLYGVDVKLKFESDYYDEKETVNGTIYVLKDGMNYKIVGFNSRLSNALDDIF